MAPEMTKMSVEDDESKLYDPPRLVEYGVVEELTQTPCTDC